MRGEVFEMILATAVVALLAALGIVLSYAVLTGADILMWNRGMTIGMYFLITGIIWAVLIIKNC